ncbi:MAG: hypoxanthine phosphoribosyltransferase [Saprospiraceae bacterium]|nr:hypoxanthine phosphoribosyltransferase [Saprospiraceae bacterium]
MPKATANKVVQLHDKYFSPFISARKIAKRVAEMGKDITENYRDKRPILLSVLNGSFVFAADLARAVETDCEISFVKLSSYQGTSTTGNVQTVMGLDIDLRDRHLIVVEDIVDTGNTLHKFLDYLQAAEPASIAIATCFFKPDALKYPLSIKYLGFAIPDKFIVGYGLDYDGLGRNLPMVLQLST